MIKSAFALTVLLGLTSPGFAAEVKEACAVVHTEDGSQPDKQKHHDDDKRSKDDGTAKPPTSLFSKAAKLTAIKIVPDHTINEITGKYDPQFKDEKLELLQMISSTLFLDVTHKSSEKDGEIHFGRMLDDGSSIEFEYQGDRRGSEEVYHLDKIVFIKPNGKKTVLNTNPLNDRGDSLSQDGFLFSTDDTTGEINMYSKQSIKDWRDQNPALSDVIKGQSESADILDVLNDGLSQLTPSDQEKVSALKTLEINIPLILRGPALKAITKEWGNLMELVSRNEIRATVKTRNINGLLVKSTLVRLGRFSGSRTAKIVYNNIFKGAVGGAVIFALAEMPSAHTSHHHLSQKQIFMASVQAALPGHGHHSKKKHSSDVPPPVQVPE